jgi:predicted transcriptional regulator
VFAAFPQKSFNSNRNNKLKLTLTSPQITLVEFEQIYDEYINLCNDEDDLELEMVSLSKVLRSIIFTIDEKEAVINGELACYLKDVEMNELQQFLKVSEPAKASNEP